MKHLKRIGKGTTVVSILLFGYLFIESLKEPMLNEPYWIRIVLIIVIMLMLAYHIGKLIDELEWGEWGE